MRGVVVAMVGFLVLATGAARAGIDFGAMPEGCSWTTRYSDGSVITETYLGRKQGKHLTEVTQGGNLVRRTTYDAKGRMVRKDWADGNWETFSPYSCFTEAGACTYRYRNSSGADQKIASETARKGKGFAVQAGPVGGERYPDEYFETGAFGVMTKNKASNYSARLIEMTRCGQGS
jgi:YD repeat-containing protein